MEKFIKKFGSTSLSDSEAETISWAHATTSKLPRELRDLAYKHLWAEINSPKIPLDYKHYNGLFDQDPPTWCTPRTANMDFTKEAFEWYYVNGCLGREIALNSIESYFQTPYQIR